MNLRDLQYIVAVAEEGHFGHASERCNVSQPALSGQIKKLEGSLGVKIFERTNRRVSVTPVGAEIVQHAKRLLLIADEIEATAAAAADPLAGRLRFGTIPTIGPYLWPEILRPLKAALPKVDLTLTEDVTENLERRLCAGEIDAAVTATVPEENGIAEFSLYHEPFVVALPTGHALDTGKPIYVTKIDSAEMLLLRDGHCLSDQVAKLCGIGRKRTFREVDTRASSLETIIGLVAAGAGVTLLPASALGLDGRVRAGISIAQASNKAAARKVRLIYRETYPKAELMKAVIDLIAKHLPPGVAAA